MKAKAGKKEQGIIEQIQERNPLNTGLEHGYDFFNFAFKLCFTYSKVFVEAAKAFGISPKRIRKGKDSGSAAIVKILEAATAERKGQQAEPHWTERFGNMVANLYGDKLTALTHNELCCSVMEIANKGNTPPNEARLMLPLGLQRIFNEPPFIRVTLHVNNKSVLLCDLIEGDLVQNFETLINSINEICRPLDIPEDGKQSEDMPVLTVELIRNDGVSFDIYKQFFPKEALNSLDDFYKQNLGKEPAAKQAKAEKPKTESAAQTTPSDVHKVIRAQRFELIDEGGKVCARLHSMRGIMGTGTRTIFSMEGKDCRSIQMVSDTDTGEMAFRILEGGEFYPVSFGVFIRPDDPRPMLEIGGSCKVGNSYLRLAVEEDMSSPSIKLYDRDDNVRAELSLSEDGKPEFQLYNDEDESASKPLIFDLCKYKQDAFHLYFSFEEESPADYEFYLTPGHSNEDRTDAYFTSRGEKPSIHTFEGFYIPSLGDKEFEGNENNFLLTGKGEIIFTGDKGAKLFSLKWDWPTKQDNKTLRFEGSFSAYDETTGEIKQSLMLK